MIDVVWTWREQMGVGGRGACPERECGRAGRVRNFAYPAIPQAPMVIGDRRESCACSCDFFLISSSATSLDSNYSMADVLPKKNEEYGTKEYW